MSKNLKTVADRLSSLFSEGAKIKRELTIAITDVEAALVAAKDRLAMVQTAPVEREEVIRRIRGFAISAAEEARNASAVSSFSRVDFSPAHDSGLSSLNHRHFFGFQVLIGDMETIVGKLTDAALAGRSASPISASERERETNALKTEIANLERMRERIARDAAAHGISIPRSELADPAVLLAPDSEL
ncbi:hypothetical protein B5K08_21835 [Rhizobium leguminosarum bv. trifolii]|uniref:Uncharacterized protein n=1 Tax=Rhizobium leguminosarum bv. trifolii TaxID=386 RepID=A0A3E1B8V2_RHILT|nr:hypothetical protein [Rhizobium leguminosarum]RFB87922.1 hypothetical protein B5K08_21835 [Rhizobium leguminosarum bv. trifolii]RFB88163.1 hypothetical protein B5K10_21830 [Rhizobium leguminosarum bv. trifolii]